jgi:hypothetical protein
VVDVSFVHGHPRRTGWVVGHVRRPNRAGQGQLPLLVVVPPSRPAAGGSGPVSSARKPAITRR